MPVLLALQPYGTPYFDSWIGREGSAATVCFFLFLCGNGAVIYLWALGVQSIGGSGFGNFCFLSGFWVF